MRTDQAQPVRLSDYRVPDYLIDTVALDVRLARHATQIVATLALRPNPAGRTGSPLVLDGDDLVLERVCLDGVALASERYTVTPDEFTLLAPPAAAFTLQIETKIDPVANTKLMGLYRSGSAYCTQCEAEGFRRITYFLDRPDVLSVYTVRIEADRAEAPVLLSNGNPVECGGIDGTDRHYAVWHDPHPKPCYLFALVGGELALLADSFVTASGRDVTLGIYTEPGNADRAAYAMDALKRSMRWDETAYGREYDLDVFNIVAVSDFNMGAMENKGLNVFNDKYVLASPATATDGDYAGIETVIAHEYFHNWTGNRITCRDWFQLCLKEGLTVFRDHEFSADMRSRPVRRIADVRNLRAGQFPEDAGPLAHNVRPSAYREINNFYTATIYEKGSEVIRMLKVLIGDDAFRRGMDLYFERCDGTATTIEVFLQCFAVTSGRDLTQFARWYHQSGTPEVRVTTSYDALAGTLSLDFTQTCPPTPGQDSKDPFVIPLAFGLVASDGSHVAIDSPDLDEDEATHGRIILSDRARRVRFRGLKEQPVPSLLRGFSAPVRLEADLSEADLLALVAHDEDSFNRWQASQTLAIRLMTRSVTAIRAGLPPLFEPAYAGALLHLLDGADEDAAFVAQGLTLPGEADLAREIGRDVDPEAIHTAREALRKDLGRNAPGARGQIADPAPLTASAMLDLSDPHGGPITPRRPQGAPAGRRALRNIALDVLASRQVTSPAVQHSPQAQFATASNMTDTLAALGVLARIPGRRPATTASRSNLLRALPGRPRSSSTNGSRCKASISPRRMQPRSRRARDDPRLNASPRLLDHQSEPRLRFADRQLRRWQPDALQRRRTARPAGRRLRNFVADIVIELDRINAQVGRPRCCSRRSAT